MVHLLTMQRALVLAALALALGACGEPDAPPQYDWDRSASKLLVSTSWVNGFVPQEEVWRAKRYGNSYLRVMGDGRVLWGTPTRAHTATLDEAALRALLEALRPDRLGGLEPHYSDCESCFDYDTTRLSIATRGYTVDVEVYALGANGSSGGAVPQPLRDAFAAMVSLRDGLRGSDYTPASAQLVATYARSSDTQTNGVWPLSSPRLAEVVVGEPGAFEPPLFNAAGVRIDGDAFKTYWGVLSSAQRVDGGYTPVIFEEDGQRYRLLHALLLPGDDAN
ncbi:MAG: hypothetical protein KC503_20870 [Myxococcales bacterium]|nr:hypothetical protein [Myxococcales bacterium]